MSGSFLPFDKKSRPCYAPFENGIRSQEKLRPRRGSP